MKLHKNRCTDQCYAYEKWQLLCFALERHLAHLVPDSVGIGIARPVLSALDVQPHSARPGLLAVGVQVVQQRAHLLVRADRARGACYGDCAM